MLLEAQCLQQPFTFPHISLPPTHPYYNLLSKVEPRPHLLVHAWPSFWVRTILFRVHFHPSPFINKSWHLNWWASGLLLPQSRSDFWCQKTLCSMMSRSEERSISRYPFTPSRYLTKIHSVLCGSSAFLFSKGIWAHARELKIWKWVTSYLRSLGVLSLTNLWGDIFWM